MAIKIEMPRLSDTMEEGTLVSWKVKVGDKVSSGDLLADVETDKATMELQAFDDGTVAKLSIDEGATVPVGETIVVLAEEGEEVEAAAASAGGSGGGSSSEGGSGEASSADEASGDGGGDNGRGQSASTASAGGSGAGPGSGGGVKASPLARKLAEEHGIDLASIAGSGPGGRVVKKDVLAAAEGADPSSGGAPVIARAPAPSARPVAPAQPDPASGGIDLPALAATLEAEEVAVSNMRKTIAKRLVESKTTVPHFQVTVEVDMKPLVELRATINKQLEPQGVKLTVNDFIVRAVALACAQHPDVNASWAGDKIIKHGTVNVGVAISLPPERGGGLVVATLRDVHHKGLRQISADTKALGKKAREKGLSPEEMSDSTVTVSNLGAPQFGRVTQFTAIINPPNAAILAVGSILETPVVEDGQVTIGQRMSITLSGDHRVIDGASGAIYLKAVTDLLENPASLLV